MKSAKVNVVSDNIQRLEITETNFRRLIFETLRRLGLLYAERQSGKGFRSIAEKAFEQIMVVTLEICNF